MVAHWSDEAVEVMRFQYKWYEQMMGTKAAQKFRQGILSDVRCIEANPLLGREEQWLAEFSFDNVWRSLVSGRKYKIIYFVDQETVNIAYVWGCTMDRSRLSSILKKRG